LDKETEQRDGAVNTFIEHNIRLAIKIAGDYAFLPTELEMRIASALDGLREAALRFEPTKAKFSTYASWWMKQRILRDSISQGRAIRLPVHMAQRVFKVSATENELRAEYGRAATDNEVADHLGLTGKQMRDVRRAQQTLTVSMEPMLDAFDNAEERDQIEDPNAIIPGTEAFSVDRAELLKKALGSLDTRERAIIDARFGFGMSGEKETLEAVGRRFHVSRERIRQLENIALKKLRKQFEKLDAPVLSKK
jgi:RNA polymerase primary sigma factor